jgi:hypothetical protein
MFVPLRRAIQYRNHPDLGNLPALVPVAATSQSAAPATPAEWL